MSTKNHVRERARPWVLVLGIALFLGLSPVFGYNLSNSYFNLSTGSNGEITDLRIVGDTYTTNYVMSPANAPRQNTSGHEWLGELMFKYRLGTTTAWSTALTQSSSDGRTQSQSGNTVTVTYQNSTNANGVKNFRVVETYSLVSDAFQWSITVTNTSAQSLEIGDFGLPLPFNEYWSGGDVIYEQRTIHHSYVGNNGSYITISRPSGVGPFLLMIPDSTTGAGFEYMDHWRTSERSAAEAAWCQDQAGWANGLNVYYIHSNVIKSTNRGYLPNTSLTLAPGASKTYTFKFLKVTSHQDVKDRLYSEGLVDVTVVPGMIFASDMTAKFSLRSNKAIVSVTPQYPAETVLTSLGSQAGGHNLYSLKLNHWGQNSLTVTYGNNEKTVLQFYALEPLGAALQRHATFMVEKTQWNAPGQFYDKIFDDWMMDTKAKRNNFSGYGGWGDDWGLTHGQFLAEKNAIAPVASEVLALDNYLETAVWGKVVANKTTNNYRVHDWLNSPAYTDDMNRGYAYPHIYNTFLGMYKIAKKYPSLVAFKQTAKEYLTRCYLILDTHYDGAGISYNWDTGQMGESAIPEIMDALKAEGMTAEYNDIAAKMVTKWNNFKSDPYPYGSEYNYDNTGEEAVYALAQLNNDVATKSKINTKVRATRGQQPLWYFYSDPVTICGEAWWGFQYTAALQGFALDDWTRNHSTTPEVDQRLSFAAKIANVNAINSGQIDSDPANIGTVAWTYQPEKGNLYQGSFESGTLHNGWRQMSGEADLGLWGAIRLLSSDVAVDPLFGLYGYACDVTQTGVNYSILPRDGVFQRLNLITQKLSLTLSRDQYTSATVATTKDYVQLTLKNATPGVSHSNTLTLKGLAVNSYDVLVDNTKVGSVTAVNGAATVVAFTLGGNSTYDLKLLPGTPPPNTAPVVNAGSSGTFTLPDGVVTLAGTASDDGLPSGSLTTTWTLQSGSGTAAFANAGALNTTVTVSAVGTYVFRLTASDGALSSFSTVTMTVTAQPEVIAFYKFDETAGSSAADASGNGKTGTITGTAAWAAGKVNNALTFNGSNTFVSLPSGLVSGLSNFTAAAWIKPSSLSTWARVFDFGTGTTNYMFLAPQAGSGWRFAITTSGNGSEQQLNYATPPTVGVWTHVAVTLSGSTGTLYVNGVQVAQNTAMTLKPSSLGTTNLNYIGKSQWNDPLFSGAIDEFKVYSRALTASEVSTLATGGTSGPGNIAPQGTASTSFVSSWESLAGLNDGYTPASSSDRGHPVYGNWNNPGTTQWIEYDFPAAFTISSVDVYWFSDRAGGGGIDVPASCSVQYWNGTAWAAVANPAGLGVLINQYNTTTFTPVSTTRIRLNMTAQTSYSTGVESWRVIGQ